MSTCFALAEIVLSIRSAKADSNEYPTDLIDSIKDGALGGSSISLIGPTLNSEVTYRVRLYEAKKW